MRFGRVLGSGARSAAKTLVQAIDAAKADNPSRPAAVSAAAPEQTVRTIVSTTRASESAPAKLVSGRAAQLGKSGRGLRIGASRFRDLAIKPFVRLSGVVVLEVVGVFFGVFALYGLNTMWRVHTSWHSGSANHRQFVGGAVMLAVFGYFCLTSFMRAWRRERGR